VADVIPPSRGQGDEPYSSEPLLDVVAAALTGNTE
jgi:hypothetical protein